MRYTDEQIAQVIHAANHELQRFQCDPAPSHPWNYESDEIRRNVIAGVRSARDGVSPRDNHELWVKDKAAHGWKWGPEKNAVKKTHPCMVPYDDLPSEQQDKNRMFVAIVDALTQGMVGLWLWAVLTGRIL